MDDEFALRETIMMQFYYYGAGVSGAPRRSGPVFPPSRKPEHPVLDEQLLQFLVHEGLRQDRIRPAVHEVPDVFRKQIPRHPHHETGVPHLSDALARLRPVHDGHLVIHEDAIVPDHVLLDGVDEILAVFRLRAGVAVHFKQSHQQLAVHRGVVHHEYAHRLQLVHLPGRTGTRRFVGVLGVERHLSPRRGRHRPILRSVEVQRQIQPERRSLARAVREGPQGPAVLLGDGLGEGQTKPAPTAGLQLVGVELGPKIEDRLELGRRHTDTGVHDVYDDPAARREALPGPVRHPELLVDLGLADVLGDGAGGGRIPQRNLHGDASALGELEGVAQQVPEDLLQPLLVSHELSLEDLRRQHRGVGDRRFHVLGFGERGKIEPEVGLLLGGHHLKLGRGLLDDPPDRQDVHLQFEGSHLDLVYVEEIVEHPDGDTGVVAHLLRQRRPSGEVLRGDPVLVAFAVTVRTGVVSLFQPLLAVVELLEDQRESHGHGVEGRADLVADEPDELSLGIQQVDLRSDLVPHQAVVEEEEEEGERDRHDRHHQDEDQHHVHRVVVVLHEVLPGGLCRVDLDGVGVQFLVDGDSRVGGVGDGVIPDALKARGDVEIGIAHHGRVVIAHAEEPGSGPGDLEGEGGVPRVFEDGDDTRRSGRQQIAEHVPPVDRQGEVRPHIVLRDVVARFAVDDVSKALDNDGVVDVEDGRHGILPGFEVIREPFRFRLVVLLPLLVIGPVDQVCFADRDQM
mmetsp:Transcript_26765/g.62888  ORF Transcript_26765/g.62888 Transcript_26765/m.62888 type:complete len:738 (+) Transcript_26765:292-2505(+)